MVDPSSSGRGRRRWPSGRPGQLGGCGLCRGRRDEADGGGAGQGGCRRLEGRGSRCPRARSRRGRAARGGPWGGRRPPMTCGWPAQRVRRAKRTSMARLVQPASQISLDLACRPGKGATWHTLPCIDTVVLGRWRRVMLVSPFTRCSCSRSRVGLGQRRRSGGAALGSPLAGAPAPAPSGRGPGNSLGPCGEQPVQLRQRARHLPLPCARAAADLDEEELARGRWGAAA